MFFTYRNHTRSVGSRTSMGYGIHISHWRVTAAVSDVPCLERAVVRSCVQQPWLHIFGNASTQKRFRLQRSGATDYCCMLKNGIFLSCTPFSSVLGGEQRAPSTFKMRPTSSVQDKISSQIQNAREEGR
jgi:hypothetical protein